LWGVAFGNLVKGVPINASMDFTGNFFDLLSPYTLICGWRDWQSSCCMARSSSA